MIAIFRKQEFIAEKFGAPIEGVSGIGGKLLLAAIGAVLNLPRGKSDTACFQAQDSSFDVDQSGCGRLVRFGLHSFCSLANGLGHHERQDDRNGCGQGFQADG